jgi:cobaltochelatase CobN
MSPNIFSCGRVCLLLLLCLPGLASAATVLGIVSERSAAEVAAGAHVFLEDFPQHAILLRTPEQLAELSDQQLRDLEQQADAIFLAAVFGDQVGRLQQLLRMSEPAKPILAINSDRRITRLSRLKGQPVLAPLSDEKFADMAANPQAGEDPQAHLAAKRQAFPQQAGWLTGRAFYQGRSPEHIAGLLRWLLAQTGEAIEVPEPAPRETVRYYRPSLGTSKAVADAASLALQQGPAVAVLDLDSGDRPGDRQLLDAICTAVEARKLQCFAVLARWGGASVEAVQTIAERAAPADVVAVVSLQDFVIGGGEGRETVTEALQKLNVPVLKGLRLDGTTEGEWRLSGEGVPRDAVHYRLAMPELQGVSQPLVLAAAQPPLIDPATGVRLLLKKPVVEQVEAMADRVQRWHRLQSLDNAEKKVAIVYYNHPPGRHNIGADKLDVPESLLEILQRLKQAGYNTGELPQSAADLLHQIQDRGVNLVDNRSELDELHGRVPVMTSEAYQRYFDTLPQSIRAELQYGPLGYLHARLQQALAQNQKDEARRLLRNGVDDVRNMLEHHEHKAQQRALDLLAQYQSGWAALIDGKGDEQTLAKFRDALIATGIPGLSGWGEAPGKAMISGGDMLFPGLHFGNVFIGPQPPRGWEVEEALLHANTSFPPTHQYVGFYHWLRDHFKADALVYLGRHSTHEFLPRRRAGLAADDYPQLLGGDLPVIYPYIVDGVGEGIQAKRRAMGVMISHLTPPLATTKLYDELLELRQLVETYEAATDPDSPSRTRAVETLRQRICELNLTAEIRNEIAKEHDMTGIRDLDEVNEELLVHEVGHYITAMQERFMPMGLHVFGRDWQAGAIDMMLSSMAGDAEPQDDWRRDLTASPAKERESLLAALEGRFVPPGRGNDPVRTPAVLPTGTNFHALSGDLIPTRVAWSLGQQMAADARAQDGEQAEGSEAVILWASDTVRDEGVMIAFGLDMLGVTPRWNSRGIVKGLERLPLDETRAQRRDVVFTTSGLFRDLYEDQLVWLDQAVRVALDGASLTIRELHPQLVPSLEAALAPLPASLRAAGRESLAQNAVAARWVADTRALLKAGAQAELAGRDAALRVFGTAPGAYGAGVNRLVERSGAWQDRDQVAAAYLRRMGHAYGKSNSGEPAHAAFAQRIQSVGRTYLGRASHLYGLLDNDDGFDYQGGLSMAVESLAGTAPQNRVLQHANANNPRVESLERALLGELRSRNLNPQWLKPLMEHGYAGARTMGADFLDNLWGWQVTNPNVVKSWVWDAVHDVYFKDSHGIGLDDFLEQGYNIHVKTHMQAVTLVAAHRGFWQADAAVIQAQATSFARAVVEHGLPGGGHTRADHPTMDWVAEQLQDAQLRQAFDAVRAAAVMAAPAAPTGPAHVTELHVQNQDTAVVAEQANTQTDSEQEAQQSEAEAAAEGGTPLLPWLILLAALLLIIGGAVAGRHPRARASRLF